MADSEVAATSGADHLCVLVHGLWGNPSHLENVRKVLHDAYPKELHILVAKRFAGNQTYDGIEINGERVCSEIEEEIERLSSENRTIKKLSVVGYSLGGLVARYAIGLLHSRGVFDRVEPINMTTFASPHLGVRTPRRGWHNQVWNVLGARTLSMSGRQLFLIDNFRQTNRPLLAIMADPNSIFMKGLAEFKRRTLYANIINDRSAVYYTTAISKCDPFADLSTVQVNYLEGTSEVIVDDKNPVSPKPKRSHQERWWDRILLDASSFITSLPFYAAIAIFVPIGLTVFLLNSCVQTFTSSRRIKLHEAGRAGIENLSAYRTPLMLKGVRGAMEDVYENLNSAQSNEYLVDGIEEGQTSAESRSNKTILGTQSSRNSSTEPLSSSIEKETNSKDYKQIHENDTIRQGTVDVPTLALTPDQFAMVDALDECGWRKFPVHIHKVRHSHAAIIVRTNRSALEEGYVVLKQHWVKGEFLLG